MISPSNTWVVRSASLLVLLLPQRVLGVPCCTGIPRGCDNDFDLFFCEDVQGCRFDPDDENCWGVPTACEQFNGDNAGCLRQECFYDEDSDCPLPKDLPDAPTPGSGPESIRYFEDDAIVVGPNMADNKGFAMILADIDGDGLLDLVTGGRAGYGNDQGCLQIALNGGGGIFRPPMTLSSDPQSSFGKVRAISVGDLDGNGHADIAVALERNYGPFNDRSAILAYFNDGNGQFSRTGTILPGNAPLPIGAVTLDEVSAHDLILNDINGDGLIDVIATVVDETKTDFFGFNDGPAALLYFRNKGKASFDIMSISEPLVGLTAITVGDFDGDGRKDIALVSDELNRLYIFYNDFSNDSDRHIIDVRAQSNWQITAGDVDGDGKLDIVCQGESTVTLYQNLGGRGVFNKVVLVETDFTDTKPAPSRRKVLVHDVDGDGLNDIVHLHTPFHEVNWIKQLQSRPLKFQGYETLNDMVANQVEIGDIDGDNIGDLVVAAHHADGNVYAFTGIHPDSHDGNVYAFTDIHPDSSQRSQSSGASFQWHKYCTTVTCMLVFWNVAFFAHPYKLFH